LRNVDCSVALYLYVIFFFFLRLRRLPGSTLFPYTTLFRSSFAEFQNGNVERAAAEIEDGDLHVLVLLVQPVGKRGRSRFVDDPLDRKSTRLNSSHVKISYAVFCLKKKNKQR